MNPDVIFVNQPLSRNDRISFEYLKKTPVGFSLLLIKVDKATPKIKIIKKRCNKNNQVRLKFFYKKIEYDLVVTDPEVEEKYKNKDEGEYNLTYNEIYLCVSLGEPCPNDNCCYKLAASIIV